MRFRAARAVVGTIVLAAVGLGALAPATRAAAQDWIRALSELQVAPADLRDTRSPIEERIALAEALGTHGSKEPALAVLEATLDADPPPPSRLAAAITRSIARRAPDRTPEPLATVLRTADARAARFKGREMRASAPRDAPQKLASPVSRDALERALCEPATAPEALRMLVGLKPSPDQPPSDLPLPDRLRQRMRAALAGSACRDSLQPVADDDPRAQRLREVAAELLGVTRDEGAVPPLRDALLSPFAGVRAAAVTALAAIATPAACAALASHARIEGSARVRVSLQRALRLSNAACGGAERS
jgi:hypothetical protein